MTKKDYLTRLEEGLSGLSQEEISERLTFYQEMIDDRMEEVLSEEEAVAQIGPVVEIALPPEETPARAAAAGSGEPASDRMPRPAPAAGQETPEQGKEGRKKMLLLILGFPLWFPLLIAAAAVVFSLTVSLWAIVLALWAVFLAFTAGALIGLILGIWRLCQGDTPPGLAWTGAGLILAGLAVFLYYGCKAFTKAAAAVARKTGRSVRGIFRRKESKK